MLTKRQSIVLDAIIEHINTTGYPPTIRDLCERTGIASTNGVRSHLSYLGDKGYITITDGHVRAIVVNKDSKGRLMRVSVKPASMVDAQAQLTGLVARFVGGELDEAGFRLRVNGLLDDARGL